MFSEIKIPAPVAEIKKTLEKAGYEAYLVGGCVRDALLGLEVSDFDLTTNAKPEEIKKLFPKSRDVGKAFAVVLVNGCEVATFRCDGTYSDHRHPDSITFAKTLEEDLSRRDFTINAMAWDGEKLIDPFGGKDDLEAKILRFVREPRERMEEDPLRALRACRFAGRLDFQIERHSKEAIEEMRSLIDVIAPERKRMELDKMLLGKNPERALALLAELGLLIFLLPELEASRGCQQLPHHPEDCFEHAVRTLKMAKKEDLSLRLACLLHDVAKPSCQTPSNRGGYTFYKHDIEAEKFLRPMLARLRYSNEITEKVLEYAKFHMRPLLISCTMKDPALQRLMGSLEHITIRDLLRLMLCDLRGNYNYSDEPFSFTLSATRGVLSRVRKIEAEKRVLKISDLPVTGEDLIRELNLQPGPEIGQALRFLYGLALKKPNCDREYLLRRAKSFKREG